jgi:hypothetical protein
MSIAKTSDTRLCRKWARRQVAVGGGVALQDGDQVGGSRLHDIRIIGQGFMGQPFKTLGRHVPVAQLVRKQSGQRAGVIVVEQHRSMDEAAKNFLFRGNFNSIGTKDAPYCVAWPWRDFLVQLGKTRHSQLYFAHGPDAPKHGNAVLQLSQIAATGGNMEHRGSGLRRNASHPSHEKSLYG